MSGTLLCTIDAYSMHTRKFEPDKARKVDRWVVHNFASVVLLQTSTRFCAIIQLLDNNFKTCYLCVSKTT